MDDETVLDIDGNELTEECLEELSVGYDPDEDEVEEVTEDDSE